MKSCSSYATNALLIYAIRFSWNASITRLQKIFQEVVHFIAYIDELLRITF